MILSAVLASKAATFSYYTSPRVTSEMQSSISLKSSSTEESVSAMCAQRGRVLERILAFVPPVSKPSKTFYQRWITIYKVCIFFFIPALAKWMKTFRANFEHLTEDMEYIKKSLAKVVINHSLIDFFYYQIEYAKGAQQ